MAVAPETLAEIALSPHEYDRIVQRLDREPNPVELGLFGALWSEHCGYKHSRPLLRLLPGDSPRVLVPAGAENAGVVDLGDGLAVALKIESHNHPSAIEPFHGAATGVGGIVRDILTMGARPVALLNSLRFGPPAEPRQRHLFHGVVGGISWYGNCIGVPDVAGEIAFDPSYAGNPLVNAMCVGLLPRDRVVRAKATGVGNLLVLVGADTGRDGIHGASGLASRTFQEETELRSAVQVANPFLEKVLIEACLEAVERHPEAIVGMQDLGAAGLAGSVVECAGRGGAGVEVDVARVLRREEGMTPYEVMLSESQERMLMVTPPEHLPTLQALFDKWDLSSTVIGRVTDDARVRISDGDTPVADLPVHALMDPPQYRLQGVESATAAQARTADLATLPLPDDSPADLLLRLLASPNVGSRAAVFRQYDQHVGTNTVVSPGRADAAVLRLPGTRRAIAVTADGNGRYCHLDPYVGGAIAVAEACRNLSCVGAEPVAVTNCLNFADPERPEVYYQLEKCIEGMADACRALGVPVVSGNVSLYNETSGQGVYPTPVIGALGLLDDAARHCTSAFTHEGDVVALLGVAHVDGDPSSLAGSELMAMAEDSVAGQPALDLDLERRLQRLCRRAVAEGVVRAAHDCSEGGLAVALAECSILGGVGVAVDASALADAGGRWDAALFGEAQSRVLVALPPGNVPALEALAVEEGVPFVALGRTQGDRLTVPALLDLPVAALDDAWRSGLGLAVAGP